MRVLTFLLLLLPLVAHPAPAEDHNFLRARDAWRAGSLVRLQQALPGVAGHPLESYARYWELQLRLEEATPEEIHAFLQQNEGTYVADQLRKEWLRVLGKQGHWALFDAMYGQVRAPESDLVCYHLLSRAQRQDPDALNEAFASWEAPEEIPEGCQPLIDALIGAGRLDRNQIWQRVRMLNQSNRATALRATLAYLPENEAPSRRQLSVIAKDPLRYLQNAARLNLKQRLNRELVIYAVQRAAVRDAEAAATRWTALEKHFSAGDRAYVWGQLGLRGALQHLPQALQWYERAELAPLSDVQLEWRARAGLRARDWAAVNHVIQHMPEALRADPTWIYWRARALQALGDKTAAVALYERIAGAPHFYGKLASEELGRPLIVPPTHKPTTAELRAAARNPGLQRAIALFRSDMWLDAVREWNWTIRGMNDRELLAAAEHARRSEVWDRAINTADRTTELHNYSLRFLAPYRDRFARQAREHELEVDWVLGLVRQESRFVAHARSPAGAAGLMQLMPNTARWMARRMDMAYRPAQITDIETNIRLGTGYLRYVYDSLDGSPVLAAAAYNAGPGRARRWKADEPLEGAIYAETIPFNETRDYVKKVMSNTAFYAVVHGGKPRPLKERLGIIPPRVPDEGYEPTITGQAALQ